MGRNDDVVHPHQDGVLDDRLQGFGVVTAGKHLPFLADGRFFLEDVEPRPAEPAAPKRLDQRFGVHQRSARCVDENRSWFHQGQPLGIDEVVRLVGVGAMQRDDVRLFQERFQAHILEAQGVGHVGDRLDVVGHDPHLEAQRDADHVRADGARSDDPQRPVPKVDAPQTLDAELAAHRLLIRLVDPPRQGKDQGEGVLGHRVRPVGRHVAHRDAARPAGVQVNMVHAGRAGGHKFQVRKPGQRCGVHAAVDERRQDRDAARVLNLDLLEGLLVGDETAARLAVGADAFRFPRLDLDEQALRFRHDALPIFCR